MKLLKVILTHPASNDIESLVSENIAYWQNRNDLHKGNSNAVRLLEEIESALEYLQTNYMHHAIRGIYNRKEVRYYCIEPSRKFALLYYVDDNTIKIICVAPTRGGVLNEFLRRK